MMSMGNTFDQVVEMDQEMGMEMPTDFNELTTTRLQKKIDIVQQILTILEKAMSSAKSSHQQNQSHYKSRIDELQIQIETLKWEMNENENKFKTVTAPLEDDLNKYMALDNILITIEENSKDDGNMMLPDISKSDGFVQKYLETDLSEWQSLKLQCQRLNYETQTAFSLSPNICTKLFRVTVSRDLTVEEQYRKAMEMANALNMHRGKKFIPMSPSSPLVRDITLSWYKDQTAAARYVQNHYAHVIQDVIGKENVGRKIEIMEMPANSRNFNSMCQTIHVQAKATSANSTNSMPQTITLYQFEETPYKSPEVTTFNVETASPIRDLSLPDEYTHTIPGPSRSVQLVPLRNSIPGPSRSVHHVPLRNSMSPFRTPEKERSKSVTGGRDETASDTSDFLALIGIDDGQKTPSRRTTSIVSSSSSSITKEKRSGEIDRDKEADKENSTSELLNDERGTKEIDGVQLQEWLLSFISIKGIKKFTNVQKLLLKSFKAPGDIHYKGVANGGKTTCSVLAVLNCIQPLNTQTQVLIVTSNTRSSKWIQNSISFGDEQSTIVCLRADEVLSTQNKVIRQPACQILVGACGQMMDVIAKNILNLEKIKHLIIDNAEEIFAAGLKTNLYKILYSLNATIKVTLISRTSCNYAGELEEFCKLKLRYPLMVEETVDIPQFLNSQPRTKFGDKDKEDRDSEVETPSRTSSESESEDNDLSSASATARKAKGLRKKSDNDNIIVGLPEAVVEPTDPECINIDSDSESLDSSCRAFIPETALKFLGIDDAEAMTFTDEQDQPTVDHLYAKLSGDIEYRVNIIKQLDIEEDKTIIFCNTIERTEWLSARLRQHELWPQVLHQEVPRKEQVAILETFRQGTVFRVLISTDFLSSICLDSANVILNFDLAPSKVVYRNRTAFADREMTAPKKREDSQAKAVVISLIEDNEYETLMGFGESLGLVIENAYKDQDENQEPT